MKRLKTAVDIEFTAGELAEAICECCEGGSLEDALSLNANIRDWLAEKHGAASMVAFELRHLEAVTNEQGGFATLRAHVVVSLGELKRAA